MLGPVITAAVLGVMSYILGVLLCTLAGAIAGAVVSAVVGDSVHEVLGAVYEPLRTIPLAKIGMALGFVAGPFRVTSEFRVTSKND